MRDDERGLIRAFHAGDMTAFDRLVEAYRHKAYSLAYQWTHNREDALDVLQEAFVRLYRTLPHWKPRAALFTWLYRVIINLSIDLQRRRKRHRTVSMDEAREKHGDLVEAAASNLGSPQRAARSQELDSAIYNAVMALPRRQQEAFILRYYQGLSLKEIASMQRCTVGSIKANLFQAVRRLRPALKPYWREQEVGDDV